MEDSLWKICRDIVCLTRSYPFKFFKAVFHKFYLIHSWILCTISSLFCFYWINCWQYYVNILNNVALVDTAHKNMKHKNMSHKNMKFSVKDFFNKCHLLRKSLMQNFIFVQWYLHNSNAITIISVPFSFIVH